MSAPYRDLLVVGVNHVRAPLEVRERLAVDPAGLGSVLEALLARGLTEALVLSTCNRVEVWAVASPPGGEAAVADWFAGRLGGPMLAPDLLYVRRQLEALRHMARVAASLDSLVVGEPQILGQVRAAYQAAAAAGAAGTTLGEAVHQALRIARRVRTETGVGRGALSVSAAAVELARRIFGDLAGRAVLLVGAGETGALAARHLAEAGVGRLTVASRTLERAEAVARAAGGKAVPFEEVGAHAATADVVICAATVPGVLVTRADVERWVAGRPRPLLLVDLGVPRNVDAAAARVPGVYLYDVDGLREVVEANRRARERELGRAEALVTEAVARVARQAAARRAAPVIRSLVAKAEEIRRHEVARTAARLPAAGPDVHAALDAMSRALVNKLLHGPIEQLKAAQATPAGGRLRTLVRQLFGLDPGAEEAPDGDPAGGGEDP